MRYICRFNGERWYRLLLIMFLVWYRAYMLASYLCRWRYPRPHCEWRDPTMSMFISPRDCDKYDRSRDYLYICVSGEQTVAAIAGPMLATIISRTITRANNFIWTMLLVKLFQRWWRRSNLLRWKWMFVIVQQIFPSIYSPLSRLREKQKRMNIISYFFWAQWCVTILDHSRSNQYIENRFQRHAKERR